MIDVNALGLPLLPFPLAITIAIIRHQLFDIDRLLSRTLVYGSLTSCIVGIYALIVGYLGTVFNARGNLMISLIATGVVAVLFQPLRERLQRGVNRLMYGERDEPYTVACHFWNEMSETIILPAASVRTRRNDDVFRVFFCPIELRNGCAVLTHPAQDVVSRSNANCTTDDETRRHPSSPPLRPDGDGYYRESAICVTTFGKIHSLVISFVFVDARKTHDSTYAGNLYTLLQYILEHLVQNSMHTFNLGGLREQAAHACLAPE